MRTDTEIQHDGFTILFRHMNIVEAERFITLVQRDHFDYTRWREPLFEDLSIEEISARAMSYVTSQEAQSPVSREKKPSKDTV